MVNNYRAGLILVGIVAALLLFSTQVTTIYGGDAGDLVTAIGVKGIPHPPGYPLYTALGILINAVFKENTLAFRAGLLSSIPTVFTALFVFDLIFQLTRRNLIAIIASLSVSFSYLLWLYGIVPEVFALNNFFIVLLLWCAYRLIESRRIKYLRLLVFLFGLSLTHHHIIIFLLPSLIFAIYETRLRIRVSGFLKLCALFIAGLLPYAYVFVSAAANSPINWLGTATPRQFLSLVTREGYGTFRAGSFAALEFPLRLLELGALAEFLWRDLRPAGVILGFVGFISIFITKRKVWKMLTFAFISYAFFLFYASFPLHQEFMLGTFERFLLPIYIIMSLFLGYGLYAVIIFLSAFINKKFILPITLIFSILPIGLAVRNYPKLSPLKYDRSAENLAEDILSSVENNAIVFLSTDTPLFNTQYLYYSQKKWPKVKLIHFTKLFTSHYPIELQAFYPEIVVPDQKDEPGKYFDEMLKQNADKFPIYSKQPFATGTGSWIPWGLLFRFFPKDKEPQSKDIADKNAALWKAYRDPLSGALSTYRHLILSDVLRVYAIARQEVAYYLAQNGFAQDAREHLETAIKLYSSDVENYTILAQVYSQLGQCDKSEEMIRERSKVNQKEDPMTNLLYGLNERICRKNLQKEEEFMKLYIQGEKTDHLKLDTVL